MAIDPSVRRQALAAHLRRIRRTIRAREKQRDRFSLLRPVLLGLGLLAYSRWGWMALGAALALLALESLRYRRIARAVSVYRLWEAIKADRLARMDLDWSRIPVRLSEEAEPGHPFAADLDLVGPHSLHALLDTAVSREGSRRLRRWLLEGHPDPEQIRARQEVIRELVPLPGFRDKLLLQFQRVSREQLDGENLLHWLQLPSPQQGLGKAFWISLGLAPLNGLLLLGHALGFGPALWAPSLLIYGGLYLWSLPRLGAHFHAVMRLDEELSKFRAILQYLEAYPYRRCPALRLLCAPLLCEATRPSRQLRRIAWLTNAVGLRMNPVLGFLLNALLPWDFVLAHLIQRSRQQCARQFPAWVEAWSELEALVSLANFAYLHPAYVLPGIREDAEQDDEPVLEAIAVGHPLIPAPQRVSNDIAFHRRGELLLLTGSNMAGKSTFLRTLGVNLCLANSGGPVCASLFCTRPMRLLTCMQVRDSIAEGSSFFYAEVKRLKAVLDHLTEGSPRLAVVLIDEIFRGTNSREHLLGSRAYLRHLASQPCVAVIATHDLELGRLEGELAGFRNCHFRDELVGDRMVFDYRLHPGICPSTNAVRIMRREGLPVPDEGEG